MTISEDEIKKDYLRFIRHEAMRANCSQEKIMRVLNIPFDIQTLNEK
jgi:hypothetical protein